MVTWQDLRDDLGVALNEADLLGFEVDAGRRIGVATFRVLTLPVEGPPPDDRLVQMLFSPVGRVVASLRKGRWDDEAAEVVPFELADLLGVVQGFDGQPIYGWEFFDVHERELGHWGQRLSLDWRSAPEGLSRSITVFQESSAGPPRHLDLCVWFDKLAVRRSGGEAISLEEFAAGGVRWWQALEAGDSRAQGYGIFPIR